jgi:hypothetical protein
MIEPEVLVNISMSFPALDREALAEHLAPVIRAAIAAGGVGTNVCVQPYDPAEPEED